MKKLGLFCIACVLAISALAQEIDAVKFTQGETTNWYLLADTLEVLFGDGTITVDGITYNLADGAVESVFGVYPYPKVGDMFTVDGINYVVTAIGTPNTVKVGDNQSYAGTNVIIPDSIGYSDFTFAVTEIEEGAFEGCTNLASVVIPKSIEEIGQYAFKDCTDLTEVTVFWTMTDNLPVLGANIFQGIAGGEGPSAAKLYVPTGATSTYEVADQWKDFIIDEPKTPTGIGNVSTKEQIKVTKIIHKGQVYIIRNDKTYNTQGVEVELY